MNQQVSLMPKDAPTRVLVITGDVLGAKMAGPAIRAWEMSKALHQVCDVRLVSTQASTLEHDDFVVEHVDEAALKRHVDWCEVLVFQGYTLSTFPWIRNTDTIIVADIYDPMHLEYLEQGKDDSPRKRAKTTEYISEVLNVQLELADFMLCASEKQRDFWLGQLSAVSRINPLNYDPDPSLRSLIDIAPFGISNTPAVQTRHAIKGSVEGIGADDQVIIWGGGVYNWFDPLTLINAVASLVERHPKLRLYFLGVKHPNPDVPAMKMAAETMRLSDELGLTGKHVFFNTEWVDYEDRVNYLLDADLGVSTHFEHVETAFSFRTRILDYLWAGLPIVSTDGDTFADLVRAHDLGAVVPPEDVDALATAIEEVLYSPERAEMSERVLAFGETMRWERTLETLLAFCVQPRQAADRIRRASPVGKEVTRSIGRLRHTTFWRRSEGFRLFVRKLIPSR
ncbi:glycosyltransferase family 4 protein [Leucobacter sp. UT-8R-CII-1-4]|uniref:glycosyltransferase family 4 protein n=1 Tax=Leucobacter sp. UT-8R-CII-1-4 TaxID=3040075 RepID=UPI0024A8F850|nr:glycosyltransferase family 4 protein [Leucobacter sp. UT-8R-CII-1-4]MDI6023769.1 glycosyltransferase family 4 protein [Leucobacter sp. UT-8R-CII-1-4]